MSKRGTVRWRLDELVAAHGGLSNQALADALRADGAHVIGRPQVGRLIAHAPQSAPIALIGALCRILDCSPNDLLGWDPTPKVERRPAMATIAQRGRAAAQSGRIATPEAALAGLPVLSESERARLVGPPVRAMPTHPLARKGKP